MFIKIGLRPRQRSWAGIIDKFIQCKEIEEVNHLVVWLRIKRQLLRINVAVKRPDLTGQEDDRRTWDYHQAKGMYLSNKEIKRDETCTYLAVCSDLLLCLRWCVVFIRGLPYYQFCTDNFLNFRCFFLCYRARKRIYGAMELGVRVWKLGCSTGQKKDR